MRTCFLLAVVAALTAVSQAKAAITIDAGPGYPPPGGVIFSGSGNSGAGAGRDLSYSNLDLSQTANLYWGVSNQNLFGAPPTGVSLDGPGIFGNEVFGSGGGTVSGNTLRLFGSTLVTDVSPLHGNQPLTHSVQTELDITITSGTGSWIVDATTLGLANPTYGIPVALWDVQSTSFTAHVDMLAVNPHTGVLTHYIDLFNSLNTTGPSTSSQGSLTTAFYWENNAPQGGEVPEPATIVMVGAFSAMGLCAARFRRRQPRG